MQLYSSECALDTISGGRSRPYPTWGGVSISCVTSCVSSRRRTTRSREDEDVRLRGAGPAGRPEQPTGTTSRKVEVMRPPMTGYDLGVERRSLVVAGALGGLAVLNIRLERSGGELSNRLGGETRYYRWRGGDL